MSEQEIQTLRPGALVSCKTQVSGNIKYRAITLEAAHRLETGEERKRWENTRTIVDPEEWARAAEARGQARSLVERVCTRSAFGLLCPEEDLPKLRAAIADARKVADEFNESAALTRLGVYVIFGRVAQDDVEAVAAISSELRELMETMQDGLRKLDVKAVREAAAKAKTVGAMLGDKAQGRLQEAIDAARAAANAAAKMQRAGEQAALEIDQAAIAQIEVARTSFLDIEEAAMVAAPAMDAVGLDLADYYGNPEALLAPRPELTPELEV